MEDIVSLFFAYAKLGIKTRFQYKLDSEFRLLLCFSEKRQELLQCIFLCLNLIQSITGISTSLCFCLA